MLLQILVIFCAGMYGQDSRIWSFLRILVTAVTIFCLYQEVWSGFTLHGFAV